MKNIEEVRKEVAGYDDNLDRKVEPRVFDLVVALKMLDFQTLTSCEGHLEEKIFFTPEVMFCSEEYNDENVYGTIKPNLAKLSEMIEYLNEFYQLYPEIEHQHRFTCNVMPGFVVELVTLDRFIVKFNESWDDKQRIHELHKKQLQDFTDFMIKKVGKAWV